MALGQLVVLEEMIREESDDGEDCGQGMSVTGLPYQGWM